MTRAFAILAIASLLGAKPGPQQSPPTSFFITSANPGQGANLGGLDGADRHCKALADAAKVGGNLQWHAYLSTITKDGKAAVNARDRIGKGPWYNAKGVKVAENLADLHSENSKLGKENSITEKGEVVNGRGDTPNMHDILTGSNLDGTAYTAEKYSNCDNWSSTSADGSARVGHHDRQGGGDNPTSWNSAHSSRGCSLENLRATGGDGRFYCFGFTG